MIEAPQIHIYHLSADRLIESNKTPSGSIMPITLCASLLLFEQNNHTCLRSSRSPNHL